MTIDLNALTNQYNQLATLSQTNQQAAAEGACAAYAQNMQAILEELKYLLVRSTFVDDGYRLLADVESELTYELDQINRRKEVAEWLQNVRDNA